MTYGGAAIWVRRLRRVRPACAALLAAAACSAQPPAVFVGESTHFRLYVDPALMPLPDAFAGENAFAALEAEWSDVATMLHMPDGKIAYYWYAPAHIAAACDDALEGGCTKEGEMEIDAPLLPDAHELNHAYTYLRAPRRPIPFLAEGIAEAIGCGNDAPIAAPATRDWRTAVAGVRSDAVYGLGGLFVRQLIRRHGIDQFLQYYEQSPERRDPALFAANFERFWGVSIDDAWADLTTESPGVRFVDDKICPCSLPAMTPGTIIENDLARTPYWTLPDLGGDALALTAPKYDQVYLRSCRGDAPAASGKGVLARLDASAGWYVPAPLAKADVGPYLSDSCAGAAHYPVSPDVLVGDPYVTIMIPPTESSTIYVAIDVPFPVPTKVSGASAICDSCDFDQDSCEQTDDPVATPVAGTFYARLQYSSTAAEVESGVAEQQVLAFSR
jgi:hypothetical protein